jgi:phage terminase large subunit
MLKFSKVFDKNYKAFKGKIRYIINQGGTSSTKTFSILQLLVAICYKQEVKIDIVGLSVPHLKSGVLNDMPDVCRQFGINFFEHYKETDKVFSFGKGTINFLAFDKLGKAHGGRRDILYMNEANHLHYNIVEQLMVRTRQTIFIDYNPTNEFWVHTKLLVEQPEETLLIRSTYKDNPFLEKAIIDMIEAKKGDGNNNFWRVYGLGELGIAEGLVYDNFEELDFDKNRFARYYNGVDWGFSNDPFAFVRVAVENDCLYICDEIYQKKLLNKDSAPLVKSIIGNEYVYCDSAEPKSVAEYQNLGVNAISCTKGAGSIETGIKHLQSYRKIYIHPSCPNVLSEFRNYEWKTDKNGDFMAQPVDAFNHALDAIRYALNDIIGCNTIRTIKGLKL